ncbi:MAG: aminomethyl-transferring glycine dehydrogenase subunit GcvPA, partial [Caldicoprobacterales bacterium]
MFPYIPATDDDIKYMLEKIGFSSVEDLFTDIPEDLKLKDGLKLDPAKSQLEVEAIVSRLANRNIDASKMPIFLGAGVYDHYIPAVVNHISSRAEFYTAYTPYQPEISQGTLQAIFEYQSMICELTDMDVANASLYDGASALAEAALMAVSVKKRPQVMASSLINPESLTILRTYLESQNIDLVLIPMDQGLTDADYIRDNISEQTAAVIIQSPNFIGYIEDLTQIEEYTHENASLLVMSVDPISLGILKTPGQLGADIAVGEGQSLGNP